MAFKKADPKQAALKVSIYGPPGSGKTLTTLLMAEGLARKRGKKIAYVDTERGTDFYAKEVLARRVHPAAFDFDALYTRSIAEISRDVTALNPAEYGVVVIDSISHIWDSAMDSYAGNKTKVDSIPMHAWNGIKKPYKSLIAFLIGSPFDVFLLGRQKNIFETDQASDEMRKVGVSMRAEGETQHEPHICIRMEQKINPSNTVQSVNLAYVEKDRTGILQGMIAQNPGFSMIEPILPLLGDVQAPAEDADERAAADADAAEAASGEKNKAKEERSIGLFREYSSALQASVPNLKTLGKLGEAIKKSKRYMLESHIRALAEIYADVRDKLVASQAKDL